MVAETMSGRLEVLVRLLGVVLFVQLASEGAVVVDALQAREGTPSSLGLHRPAAPGPSTGLTRDATVARYYAPIYGRVSVCLSHAGSVRQNVYNDSKTPKKTRKT